MKDKFIGERVVVHHYAFQDPLRYNVIKYVPTAIILEIGRHWSGETHWRRAEFCDMLASEIWDIYVEP